MKKILHLHGFSSSGQCDTSQLLQKFMPEVLILSPDLPPNANEAKDFLVDYSKSENPDLIIGTSMGAFFAQQLRGFKKILFNPSFYVSKTYRRNIGPCQWSDIRKNNETDFIIDEDIIKSYENLEKIQFDNILSKDINETIAIFAENDEIVNSLPVYIKYYKRYFYNPDSHFPSPRAVQSYLVPHSLDFLVY